MKFIGIDPGLSGAIAILEDEDLDVHDMPVLSVNRSKEINIYELARIIDQEVKEGPVVSAAIEHVWSSPQMGVVSAFNFGQGFMAAKMALAANFIPMTLVLPSAWKKAHKIGTGSKKDASRARATSLFPRCSAWFARAKDDGRAEATLIAWWCRQQYELSRAKGGA